MLLYWTSSSIQTFIFLYFIYFSSGWYKFYNAWFSCDWICNLFTVILTKRLQISIILISVNKETIYVVTLYCTIFHLSKCYIDFMDILCKFMHETQLFVETADLPLKGKKKTQNKNWKPFCPLKTRRNVVCIIKDMCTWNSLKELQNWFLPRILVYINFFVLKQPSFTEYFCFHVIMYIYLAKYLV